MWKPISFRKRIEKNDVPASAIRFVSPCASLLKSNCQWKSPIFWNVPEFPQFYSQLKIGGPHEMFFMNNPTAQIMCFPRLQND